MKSYTLYFKQFKEGDERGLAFFYRLWYRKLYHWGLRYTKDDLNADCMVSEAFLRGWWARGSIHTVAQLELFVKRLIAEGCRTFYRTAKYRFQQNMLRLDELSAYQDWLVGFDARLDSEEGRCDELEINLQQKKQWAEVAQVIPSLHTEQQLFLRLCMKYGFDYGRMAWHMGGISDDQVAQKVEKTLKELRAILTDTKKLGTVKNSRFTFQGDVSEEQSEILRMRYTLGYSFAEIAKELNLAQGHVQQAFAEASLKIKKRKVG